MSWWRKPEPEKRSSAYSAAIIESILVSAGGAATVSASATAAFASGCGLIARMFAGASVVSSPGVAKVLPPSVLAAALRNLLVRGESIHLIEVDRAGLRLVPVGSWDISGGADPESWFYRLDVFGPSSSATRIVSAASVLHFRYAVDPSAPWRGLGPLQLARGGARLAAEVESALTDEASGPRGNAISIPKPGEDDSVSSLREKIAQLRGRTMLVESSKTGWQTESPEVFRGAPGFKPERLGSDPPDALVSLRSDSAVAVLGALGVPSALFDPGSQGVAKREAARFFFAATVKPIARLLEQELSLKLEAEVKIQFDDVAFADYVGRAAIAAKLAGIEGVEAAQALDLAGL